MRRMLHLSPDYFTKFPVVIMESGDRLDNWASGMVIADANGNEINPIRRIPNGRPFQAVHPVEIGLLVGNAEERDDVLTISIWRVSRIIPPPCPRAKWQRDYWDVELSSIWQSCSGDSLPPKLFKLKQRLEEKIAEIKSQN